MFLEETSIQISRLSKDIHLQQCGWELHSPLRPRQNKKVEKGEFALSSEAGIFIFFCPWVSELHVLGLPTVGLHSRHLPLVLRPSDLPPSLSLQLADDRSRDFSASIIAWLNSHNKISLNISVWILLVLFFSRSLTNTVPHAQQVQC